MAGLKYIFVLAFFIFVNSYKAQVYAASNFTFLSLTNPEVGVNVYGDKYSACWGWTQPGTNREYAIACSKSGTYWIDVTNPLTPTVCAFKAGTSSNGVWRETKTYQNYCYVACDDGSSTGFQIFDMSTLPATVTLVSQNNFLFKRGHTLWIDGNKLYVAGITYSNNTTSSMNVYSLATPTAPVLLRRLNQDYNFISYVHDMFVRNDTVYASCGNQGLYVFKFNPGNTFTQLGSLVTYTASGYNHSSALTPDGQTLVFTDEVPTGLPIKIANVTNLANIQVVATTNQNPQTTPHNPFIVNNQYCFMSSYLDGTQLYDISNPAIPVLAGFFDTFPQGGTNNNNWGGDNYDGQWGCYPYFQSRNIFACDQKNGLFMLKSHLFQNPQAAFNSPGTICAGSTLTLVNTSTASTSYSWTFNGGNPATSAATNPVVSYSTAGVYTINLIAANNTSTASAIQTVTVVNVISTMNFTNASCGVCSDGSANVNATGGTAPYTYSWMPSGGNSPVANNLLPGCYTVTIQDLNGCSGTSSVCIGIISGLGSNNIEHPELLAYPNPASAKITLKLSISDPVLINIKNAIGELVYEKHFKGQINEDIDVKNFANGVYFISVTINDQTSSQKLIINH